MPLDPPAPILFGQAYTISHIYIAQHIKTLLIGGGGEGNGWGTTADILQVLLFVGVAIQFTAGKFVMSWNKD